MDINRETQNPCHGIVVYLDRINVHIPAVILYCSFTSCYHWEKLDKGTMDPLVLFLTYTCESTITLKQKMQYKEKGWGSSSASRPSNIPKGQLSEPPETAETSNPAPESKWLMALKERRMNESRNVLPEDHFSKVPRWQRICSMTSHHVPSQHSALTGGRHEAGIAREMMAESSSSWGTALAHEYTGRIMTVKLGNSGKAIGQAIDSMATCQAERLPSKPVSKVHSGEP